MGVNIEAVRYGAKRGQGSLPPHIEHVGNRCKHGVQTQIYVTQESAECSSSFIR